MTTSYPHTTADLAAMFGCGARKVRVEARRLGLGLDLGGRAGYRYSDADVSRLERALRVSQPVPARRRRRRAA